MLLTQKLDPSKISGYMVASTVLLITILTKLLSANLTVPHVMNPVPQS